MDHPYAELPQKAFWKPAVADRYPEQIADLWDPAFHLRKRHKVATFGSCFAQHISRALRRAGYGWIDAEPLPSFVPTDDAARLNYGVYSARTGNIYTCADLRQWLGWAAGDASAPAEAWHKDGRVFDPFRPAIEPGGFASVEEMQNSRRATIDALRDAVERADLFVFTMGLTESWRNRDGYSYAMCPGTLAGSFDSELHHFHNDDAASAGEDLRHALKILRRLNPKIRVLLTVSPVPLTATASGQHVLTATTYSKSVLRAVAGQTADRFGYVDYFPSYEIITSPPFGGRYFMPNKRSVAQEGVDFVMSVFLSSLERKFGAEVEPKAVSPARPVRKAAVSTRSDDLVCEEEMLSAFG